MQLNSVGSVRPTPASTSLTTAVRQLAGNDEELKQTETDLQSARTQLETFQTNCSLTGITRQVLGRHESSYGIWILCVPPIAGMILSSNIGGTVGAVVFGLGLAGVGLGFYLMRRAAKAEAIVKHAEVAPQESALKQRVTELETRYQSLCAQPGAAIASIRQDQHKVVVNGIPLLKRKDRP